MEKVIAELKRLSEEWSPTADTKRELNVYDRYGGNMDDAFWGGYNAGQVDLAVRLLKIIAL